MARMPPRGLLLECFLRRGGARQLIGGASGRCLWRPRRLRVRIGPMQTPPALSYSHGTSTVPLLGETIGANLERTCRTHADREALVDLLSGRRWTYQQLNADVDTLALGLLDLGIEKGDRVG